MTISVSFINMKGGVGKTTLAVQVAHAADAAGYKTLVVDLDPQSNLSQSLLTPEKYVEHLKEDKQTVVQIFDRIPTTDQNGLPKKVDAHDIIIEKAGYSYNSSLDLIPSRLELSHSLKNPTGKERKLAKALAKVSDQYDLIIIDCAPTESILTEAAYFASQYVLVPVRPEILATIGLPMLARSIGEFNMENEDHQLSIIGIVFNHSSYSEGPEVRQSIEEVKAEAEHRDWPVFDTHIHYSASYPKSAREGTPISYTSYVRSDVIAEFRRFSSEFFSAIGLPGKST